MYQERVNFINVYQELDKWLNSIDFKPNRSYKTTTLDYHYSWYEKYVDAMYGVEHYNNNVLEISIYFIRDKNEHKIFFVNDGLYGGLSKCLTIEEFKTHILAVCKEVKQNKLIKLNQINYV